MVTAEQIAAFLAGDDFQTGFNVSNAVLRQLTATAEGDVLGKVQDPEWLVSTMQSAAEAASVPAPDAGKAQAVADAIVLVNNRLVEVKDTEGAEDSEQLLTGWAKAAHVGDVLFADHAAQFGAGDMAETEFKCGSFSARWTTALCSACASFVKRSVRTEGNRWCLWMPR